MSFLVIGSSYDRPIRRLMAKKVRSGLVTACRFAGWPTRRSPSSVNATIEGVVRAPSEFSMTLGVAPSMTATHELVVPRSMPITFAIVFPLFLSRDRSAPRRPNHENDFHRPEAAGDVPSDPLHSKRVRGGSNAYSAPNPPVAAYIGSALSGRKA